MPRFPRVRRSIRRRRNARKIFGKKAVRAIKAISQKPVETKWYPYNSDVLQDLTPAVWPASFGANSGYAFYRNIFNPIPRTNNPTAQSRMEVIGQQFMCRGVSVKLQVVRNYPDGAEFDQMRVRVTVLAFSDYINQSSFAPLTLASDFFENDSTLLATARPFNMDHVHVLKSRTFTLGVFNGMEKVVKMWVPLKKKMNVYFDEGTVSSNTVQRLKDTNYYLVIETMKLGQTTYGWTPPGDAFLVETKVYFKDA